MYCHARDRGTEVEVGITPDAGISTDSIGVCVSMCIIETRYRVRTRPVINRVITPITPLIRSYNPIYSWCLGPRVLPSRPLVDSHCVPPGSKQKGKNASSEEVPRGFLRLLYRGQLSYPFWGNQRILVQMYG